jgi:phosphoribosylaminoimidazolecarboxamide formyltransferase/IMP cyclohydrolase
VRALISVHDKTGIVDFARALESARCELVSTGGTFKTLKDAGLKVRQVSDVTGFPEVLDGRVKTLHPHIHAALLARRDLPAHMQQLRELNVTPIDMVVVNLYPFVQTISKPGVTLEDALENIDIGGPTMLRAAAKNYPAVAVVVDPSDYGWLAQKVAGSGLTEADRRKLAYKAFQHVASYDAAVSQYLSQGVAEELPEGLNLAFRKAATLRYGENPHQKGALYLPALGSGGIARAEQLHGKELSYNNLMDADAAWNAASDFDEPTVAVIKHTNPCGLASDSDLAVAYKRAFDGDPVSAFGGIVAFNRPVTLAAAEATRGVFYEVMIAPDYEPSALEVLQKRRDLRILKVAPLKASGSDALWFRPITGGLLVNTPDDIKEEPCTWKVVTKRKPTAEEMESLAFAWKVAKHIKSNAITIAKGKTLLGMGAGQPNRVNSVRLALQAAGEKAKGAGLASDAMFPFPDNIEVAGKGGVTAIAQPGGSIRDEEVIRMADSLNLAMVFTGVRHFRH